MKYRVMMRETQEVEVSVFVEADTEHAAKELAYEGEWYDQEFGGVLCVREREVIEAEEM
jgi:hypothetical protein